MTDASFEIYARSLMNDADTALLSAAEFVVLKLETV
jgi:hypothetical protein